MPLHSWTARRPSKVLGLSSPVRLGRAWATSELLQLLPLALLSPSYSSLYLFPLRLAGTGLLCLCSLACCKYIRTCNMTIKDPVLEYLVSVSQDDIRRSAILRGITAMDFAAGGSQPLPHRVRAGPAAIGKWTGNIRRSRTLELRRKKGAMAPAMTPIRK